jgi:hypothetical protein
MIINYNLEPKQSPLYVSAYILNLLKSNRNFVSIFDECLKDGFIYSSILLAFDFLFLMGMIKSISVRGELT